jgi:formamidopyrimidine-DNA glycosylase
MRQGLSPKLDPAGWSRPHFRFVCHAGRDHARGGIRTHDLRLRRPTLYPTELLAQQVRDWQCRAAPEHDQAMPELPDVTVYVDRLAAYTLGQRLERLAIVKPFVLRTAEPPVTIAEGRRVVDVRRLGKRIVLALEGDLHLVLHLMIAGRLRWRATPEITMGGAGQRDGKSSGSDDERAVTPAPRRRSTTRPAPPPRIAARLVLATFHFPAGTLYFTEAGTTRRASLHLALGAPALAAFDRGGLEVLDTDLAQFAARLQSENHTLKRALTDPRLFSGIGNAYSDEILHRARLSPLALTTRLPASDVERLHAATRTVLTEWTDRLRSETGSAFPETVTAFREGMAVHGRFGQPCPVCGAPVQRIRYAANETNYCARCQTGGRLLADRALSRLLKQDWPRSIDEID